MLVCTGLLGVAVEAQSEPRHALVVGVSAQQGSQVEPDAKDITNVLSQLGFDVLHEDNVSVTRMSALLADFSTRLKQGGVGLFYYAGHGAQVDGHNYLMPVAGAVQSLQELKAKWIDLDQIIDAMQSTDLTARFVFLDACRDNPFLAGLPALNPSGDAYIPGLAKPDIATEKNTLISFATAPGMIAFDGNGRDDWYTVAITKFLPQAGLQVDAIMQRVGDYVDIATGSVQIPWVATSLQNGFFFRDPVFVEATLLSIDDALVLTMNGEEALASDVPTPPRKIPLQVGLNRMTVRVYNQHTFTGGIEGLGGHLPEGWNYRLRLQTREGRDLVPVLSATEDRPAKDGSHHGHLFTVASADIVVDERSGAVTVRSLDPDVWRH